MIGLVLVTHGNLANEFISAMQHVVGKQEQVAAVCIGPEDDMEMRRNEILEKVNEVDSGKGVVLYLNQEGRGIGLMAKIAAYKLQEEGYDTVDANIHLGYDPDERDYGVGAQILRELGVHKMRLLTNNPVKRVGLEAYGLEIVENVPIEIQPNKYNERYLRTKKERMGHTLHLNN